MKRLIFFIIASVLPAVIFAGKYTSYTFLELDPETGLLWLQDYTDASGTTTKGERYVTLQAEVSTINSGKISSGYFFSDGNFRPAVRSKYSTDGNYITKSQFEAVISFVAPQSGQAVNHKGIEYFQNATTIKITLRRAGGSRTNGSVIVDLSKNKNCETLVFYGGPNANAITEVTATEMQCLKEVNISNTKITSLDLTEAIYLTTFKADNTPLSSPTLPKTAGVNNSLSVLSVCDNTALTSIDLTGYNNLTEFYAKNTAAAITFGSITNLKTVEIDGNTTISSLDFINCNKLARISFRDCTGITDPSNITWPTNASTVTSLYIDATGSGVHDETFCLSGYQNLEELNYYGCKIDCVGFAGVKKLVLDLSDEESKAGDLSSYTNLEDLTLIDVESITGLASGRTTFTLDITGSPNLPMTAVMAALEDSKSTLQTFKYVDNDPNIEQGQDVLNMTGFTALTSVEIVGHVDDVTMPSSVQEFTAKNTGINSLDLSTLTGLRKLDLTGSKELTTLIMPTESQSTLITVILRGCQSLSEIMGATFGQNYTNLRTVDISETQHAGNKVLDNVVIGYRHSIAPDGFTIQIDGDSIVNNVKTLDLTHCTNLVELYISASKVQFLDVHGLTKLKKLVVAPARDYLGPYEFNNGQETLEKVDISGCTSLQNFSYAYLDQADDNLNIDQNGTKISASESQAYMYSVFKDLRAAGCTSLKNISLFNSLLERLDVSGGGTDNLSIIQIINGRMTTAAFERSGISNVCTTYRGNDFKFVAHRNRLTDARFITVPGIYGAYDGNDGFELSEGQLEQIQQLQLNGGSYMRTYPKITEAQDGTILVAKDRERHETLYTVTNNIRELDISYLKNLQQLFCADNLLRTLNFIPENKSYLDKLEISNNSFTQLDMSNVSAARLVNYAYPAYDWNHQVTFRELELIKGSVWRAIDGSEVKLVNDVAAEHPFTEDGENDILMLYLPYAKQDETITDFTISHEDDDYWAAGEIYHETGGSEGIMDIIPIDVDVIDENGDPQVETRYFMKTHDGAVHSHGDIDMHRMIGRYTIANHIDEEGLDISEFTPDFQNKVLNLNVKVHFEPYVVYVNPATRSGAGVDYFSSTVCLSYEWRVPKGIEAYVITGLTKKGTSIYTDDTDPEGALDYRLKTIKIGEEGDIIPKNTPVYLRSVPVFEAVVQANGTTPAKKFAYNDEKGVYEETQESTGTSHAAGFYALHKNWDVEYVGWENNKGLTDDLAQLYINKKRRTNNIAQTPYYEPSTGNTYTNPDNGEQCCKPVVIDGELKYFTATEFKENVLDKNLLRCQYTENTEETDAMYYDSFDPSIKSHYSFDYQTLPKWKCLTLGREKKQGTGMIGFWAFTGTRIDPHRCYILGDDLLATIDAQDTDASSIGFSFYFEPDQEAHTTPNDIQTVTPTTVRDSQKGWFTISGVRLAERPSQRGLYIHDGRKEYVK